MAQERNKIWVLAGLLLMELLAAVDTSGVTVMVPTLQKFFQTPPEMAGFILDAYLISFTVFMVPIGWYADRSGSPEKVLKWCILGFALSSLLCAIAPNFETLLMFRFIKGIFAAGMFTVEFVIIIKYWQEPRRIVEIAVIGIGVGIIIGPIVGGLFSGVSWRYFFLFGTAFALIAFVAYQKINQLEPVKREADETPDTNTFTQRISGLVKIIIWGMLLNFVIAFATQGTNLLVTLHVQEFLGKSPLFNSALLVMVALGMVIQNGIGIGSRLVKNLKLATWGSAALFAVILILIPLVTNWINPLAFILFFFVGITLGVSLSTIELMTLENLPTKNLALGNGLVVTCMQAGYAVGSGVIPVLYLSFGPQTAYLMACCIIATIVIYAIFGKKN